MKIVLIWRPDERTTVSVEGKDADKVIAAAEKLAMFTASANVVSVGNPPTTDMPNNPKNRPK